MGDLTQERLKEVLNYDPDTGIFTWAFKYTRTIVVGRVAGHQNKKTGRVNIRIGRNYKAHRLAWLYTYGKWPDGEIDHINGNSSDNRIANLRDVTLTENSWNKRKAMSTSKTGLLGVVPRGDGFKACIMKNRKLKHLGQFKTAELAHEAYLKAKREMHTTCTI
jgi:hypothetical protein